MSEQEMVNIRHLQVGDRVRRVGMEIFWDVEEIEVTAPDEIRVQLTLADGAGHSEWVADPDRWVIRLTTA